MRRPATDGANALAVAPADPVAALDLVRSSHDVRVRESFLDGVAFLLGALDPRAAQGQPDIVVRDARGRIRAIAEVKTRTMSFGEFADEVRRAALAQLLEYARSVGEPEAIVVLPPGRKVAPGVYAVDSEYADDVTEVTFDGVQQAATAYELLRGFVEGVEAAGRAPDVDAATARAAGRRAATLTVGGDRWLEHLGPVLDIRGAMQVLGVASRQAVYDLARRRRLLAIPRQHGSLAFPTFQFDPSLGRPYPVVPAALAIFAAAGVDSYTVASWFCTEQDDLAARPVDLLPASDAEALVLSSAERAAARWSR